MAMGWLAKLLGRSRDSDAGSMMDMRLIAGLGNPGGEYEKTRHNAGFEVVDLLAEKLGLKIRQKKFGGLMDQGLYAGKKLILLKPQKYMNRSGQVIATAAGFFRLTPEQMLVITDDMALEPGRLRMRTKGSAGGHNGLADIIEKLGTNEFARLRLGIGKSPYPDSKDYVLGRPGAEDRKLLDEAEQRAVEAVCCWLEKGADAAMSQYNT